MPFITDCQPREICPTPTTRFYYDTGTFSVDSSPAPIYIIEGQNIIVFAATDEDTNGRSLFLWVPGLSGFGERCIRPGFLCHLGGETQRAGGGALLQDAIYEFLEDWASEDRYPRVR